MNKDSKIAILGAGVEGLGLAKYLYSKGYLNLTIFDEQEDPSTVGIEKFELVTGKDAFSKIKNFNFVFRSPGIHLKKLNDIDSAVLTSTTNYFFQNHKGLIIGVTGTKGK